MLRLETAQMRTRNAMDLDDNDDVPPRTTKKRRVVDSDDDEPYTIDDAGITGDAIQLPSPAVWRIIKRAVANGARSADSIITALGGDVVGDEVPEILSRFSIECCLAVAVSRDDVRDKSAIRILHSGSWVTASLRNVGGMRFAQFTGKTSIELTSKSWWYACSMDVCAAPATRRVAEIKLTGRATVEGKIEAARLCKVSSDAQATEYLLKRIAGCKSVGYRMTCLAILAINEFQTADEIATGQTLFRNGRGWSSDAAPIAHSLTVALRNKRLLTRGEMDQAQDIVSRHVLQLLKSAHLAEVLAFGAPDEQIVDESEETYDVDDGFVVRDTDPLVIYKEYPETNAAWVNEFGTTEYVLRIPAARFLNYYAYSYVRSLRATHGADIPSIIQDMKQMWRMIRTVDVHIALAHEAPSFVSAVGQKVFVWWGEGFSEGTVAVYEPAYIFVKYTDSNAMAMDGPQLCWHYVV